MTTCTRCHRQAAPGRHGYCRWHAEALGAADTYTDSTPVAEHVDALLDAGWECATVARAAGLRIQTVYKLRDRTTTTVRKSTADGILAIRPDDTDDPAWIPAWPYQRRLRALQAAGWSQHTLATAAGVTQSLISKLSNGRRFTTRATAEVINDMWRELQNKPVAGPPTDVAARRKWAVPMEWDNIDDPDEHHPDPGVLIPVSPNERKLAGSICDYYEHRPWQLDCIEIKGMRYIANGKSRRTRAVVIDAIYSETDRIRDRKHKLGVHRAA